jgi:hypothetical protein
MPPCAALYATGLINVPLTTSMLAAVAIMRILIRLPPQDEWT